MLSAIEKKVADGYGYEKIEKGHLRVDLSCNVCGDSKCAIWRGQHEVLCEPCFRYYYQQEIREESVK